MRKKHGKGRGIPASTWLKTQKEPTGLNNLVLPHLPGEGP